MWTEILSEVAAIKIDWIFLFLSRNLKSRSVIFWIQQCDVEYCSLLTVFRWILQYSKWKILHCKWKGSVIYSAWRFWQCRRLSVPSRHQCWKQPFISFKFFPFLLHRTHISHRVSLPHYNYHFFTVLIISSLSFSIWRQFSLGLNRALLYKNRRHLEVSAANTPPGTKELSLREESFLKCFQF